ncbi:vascular cell adhesion protein 1-like [Poecilia latipinna]|uniref:vascular cell adhesion protein 1-like n=1 Tax=Poecilia latipinna TaxID=48699 RepID=UPI00072E3548|nr:PREDICTED: vascular cell adhesion protein 1-like [Poecilia latipinna]
MTDVENAPVTTKPSISPSGLVSAGTRVKLSCNGKAKPPITSIAWFRKSKHGEVKVSEEQVYSFSVTPTEEGDYYCEATNELGSENSTTTCVDIIDAPFTPSLHVSTGNLKEHRPVTVTCSASTPCPQSQPELTWNLKKDSLRQTEKNTDGTFTTKIQKTFTLTYKHDEFIIICSARHPAAEKDNVVKTEVTLDVSYAPKDTSASFSPSDFVTEDSWVELSCSSKAKPSPTITWFKKGRKKFTKVATGIFHKVKFTQGDQYYCVAANKLGKQKSSPISLIVERKFCFLFLFSFS